MPSNILINFMIKIYFDENLPPQLARGLAILEMPNPNHERAEVKSIKDAFGEGIQDEDWIPKLGRENAVVITQDRNIQNIRRQRELYEQYKLGVFFFIPPSKNGYSYWHIVEKIISRWSKIKLLSKKTERPFAFRCPCKGEMSQL